MMIIVQLCDEKHIKNKMILICMTRFFFKMDHISTEYYLFAEKLQSWEKVIILRKSHNTMDSNSVRRKVFYIYILMNFIHYLSLIKIVCNRTFQRNTCAVTLLQVLYNMHKLSDKIFHDNVIVAIF